MSRRRTTWLTLGLVALAAGLMVTAAVTTVGALARPLSGGSAGPTAPALTLTPAASTSGASPQETSSAALADLLATAAAAPPTANGSGNELCCHVIANPNTQDRPANMAVDTAANLVFVSNWGSGTVSILSGTYPFAPAHAPVSVGPYPNGEAYDPNNCTVWVTLWSSDKIVEISDGSSGLPGCPGGAVDPLGTIVRTITLPASNEGPYGIAYDSEDQVMLVTDQGYGPVPQNVTVICAQANAADNACSTPNDPPHTITLTGYPDTSTGPKYVAWDPVDDYFGVTNPTGKIGPEVDMFACTAGVPGCSTTANWALYSAVSLPTGSSPSGIAYVGTGTVDGSVKGGTGTFWVADGGTNSVDVICTPTSVAVVCPSILVYPPGIAYLYSFAVPAGTSPSGIVFFPPCNEVFVTGFGGNDVLVYADELPPSPGAPPLRATVPVGEGTLAAVYDGEVIVSNYGQNASNGGNGNVTVILCSMCNATPCNYTITFNESGLPAGTTWDVDLNGMEVNATVTTTGTGTTITFDNLCVGSYTYVVSIPTGYASTNPSGVVSIPASQAPGTEVYVKVPFTSPCTYTVTFNETGLPSKSTWDVSLNGTTLTATVVTSTSGTGQGQSITFSGLCPGAYNYTVSVPKGYTANPSSGQVTIPVGMPAGSEVYQKISFQNLEFTEKGLPVGTNWDVTIVGSGVPNGSETITSNGTLISFSVPVGKYRYNISKPCEYAAKPLTGSVGVSHAVKVVPITFTLLTKTVTFRETGLPAGSTWVVAVTGPEPFSPFAIVTTTYTETHPTFAITTVCGNYSWNASSVATHGAIYTPTPASGTFAIAVTGNTITKVPPANPIVIHYVP